jgi:uncharacterized protein (DUF4415 family)
MRVTYDPAKRARTFTERGLDFEDAALVFAGATSAGGKPMAVKKSASRRSLKSDLRRVDAHVTKAGEYRDLPELTNEMPSRAVVKKGGRPVATNPKKLITIRLPADVIDRWRATGPGWQTRMADRLSRSR